MRGSEERDLDFGLCRCRPSPEPESVGRSPKQRQNPQLLVSYLTSHPFCPPKIHVAGADSIGGSCGIRRAGGRRAARLSLRKTTWIFLRVCRRVWCMESKDLPSLTTCSWHASPCGLVHLVLSWPGRGTGKATPPREDAAEELMEATVLAQEATRGRLPKRTPRLDAIRTVVRARQSQHAPAGQHILQRSSFMDTCRNCGN